MKSNFPYYFHGQLILRAPSLPLNEMINEESIFEFSQRPFFKESIYLASPVLYNEMIKWHVGALTSEKEIEKLKLSLNKYISRMKSRCTPYGLFASCSTLHWSDTTNIVLKNAVARHTRLDMNYLCSLSQSLSSHSEIAPVIKFFPNNSHYTYGDSFRYIEYKYLNNKRIHQISSVDRNHYLQEIIEIAKEGLTIDELANHLVNDEISISEATDFIIELIENQLLISDLEPSVTGDEFIHQLISKLKSLPTSEFIRSVVEELENTKTILSQLDLSTENNVERYRSIFKSLQKLGNPVDENQLFQTDSFKNLTHNQLNKTIQDNLLEAIGFLKTITENSIPVNLNQFKERFRGRYEDAEVPLLEVLDTETGIGYLENDKNGVSDLLDDLYIPGNDNGKTTIHWTKKDSFLHKLLMKAQKRGENIIHLTDADLKAFDSNHTDKLPITFPLMFRLVDHEKIYLQPCAGSSSANILGRFAHGDQNIHEIIKSVVIHEEKFAENEDKIIAEIVHLPESRVGNILLRPTIHKYEIPYLGKSTLPRENQIQLQDLMISVKGDKLILRSKSLNKEILPRLTTAHNFSSNALPVYQLLGDLQTQYVDQSGFYFHWGELSRLFSYFPRVEYKNVILHRAKWKLQKSDYQELLELKEDSITKIKEWRDKLKIPDQIILVEADNELLIDFNQSLSIRMFIHTIKKRTEIILEEFLFDNEKLVVKDVVNKGYTNEFVALLFRNEPENFAPVRSSIRKHQNLSKDIQKDFHLGSEWLFYKLYCGTKTGDKILSEILRPLTDELIKNNLIDKFFFIRYNDPELHIRIRFHLTDLSHLGRIVEKMNAYTQDHCRDGLITTIQLDTYRREMNRYGENTIELAESLFYIDSETCLQFFDLIDLENGEAVRWQFALKSIDELLNGFGFSLDDKKQLLEALKLGFIKEHGNSKELKVQLDTKYRKLRKQVYEIMDIDPSSELYGLQELLDWKRSKLQNIANQIIDLHKSGQLQVPIQELMASYIHMCLNRIFAARQRTYEMVIYDLLYKFYVSEIARSKKTVEII
jgi:lantibiotic biosynthesis protein